LTIMLPPWLAVLATVMVCGGALWKGAAEERATGAAILVAIAATRGLRDYSWPVLQRGDFIADTLLFLFLFVMAMRTRKYWPLAAAGFQLLAVMTHIGKMLDPAVQQWAYLTAQIIWTWLVMGALAVGALNAWRAQRQEERAPAPPPRAAAR
jgi:hypothetical protein